MDIHPVNEIFSRLFCIKVIDYFVAMKIDILEVDTSTNGQNSYITDIFSFSLFHSNYYVWKRIENILCVRNTENNEVNYKNMMSEGKKPFLIFKKL